MKIFGRWIYVGLYIIGIGVVTPYLPYLIRFASSSWSGRGVSHLVLGVEIFIALATLGLAVTLFILKTNKSFIFFSSVGGIILLSLLSYQYLPNPYEYTHLPEYAILSMLIMKTINKGKRKGLDSGLDKITKKEKDTKLKFKDNPYFLAGSLAGFIGIGDEVYQYFLPNRFFTWYDIFLNILGGILGLLIFWGIKSAKNNKSLCPKEAN